MSDCSSVVCSSDRVWSAERGGRTGRNGAQHAVPGGDAPCVVCGHPDRGGRGDPADLGHYADRDDKPRLRPCRRSGDVRHFAPRGAPRRQRLPPHLSLGRSEEHTSELQSLMRISYAVFCLTKKKKIKKSTKLIRHRYITNTSVNTQSTTKKIYTSHLMYKI